jgi:hypothetical protein
LGIVAQGRADLLDAEIDSVLEVDECAVGPDLPPQFIASDQFAGIGRKDCQDSAGLVLKLDKASVATQLGCL